MATVFVSVSAWVVVSRGSRWSLRVLMGASLVYALGSTYVIPTAIKRVIVGGFSPLARADVPPGRVGIVLLGSGTYLARDWDGGLFPAVDKIGASRVAEAARLYRLLQPEVVISSGGLLEVDENSWPSGASMADALVSLGVPRERILVEDRSETTHREAVVVKEILSRRPLDHIVLVTSPVHMRRSLGTFRAEGLDCIPAIAHETPPLAKWWEKLIPTDKGLEESGMVVHELTGLVAYRLRGWYR